MRIPLPQIQDPIEELKQRLRQSRDGRVKQRLQLLVLIGTGEVTTRQQAAERLMQHRNTIGRWLKCYETEGLESYLRIDKGGAPEGLRNLPPQAQQALAERLADKHGFTGYGEIQQWLAIDYGLQIPYSTVHRWVRYCYKAKLKRPRPEHPKKTLVTQPPSLNS